ncbi:MAG: hypothetical protein NXY57DRAFT_967322 [Lentinula lateritia]|nr:MAG: hypothetical protein NXY57DRAFT_967322 [Lentinula lateritia]
MPPKTRAQSRANSEENTFFTTPQSFAPFSESISAIGQPRCCNCGFGPATVPTTSTLPEDQQFEYKPVTDNLSNHSSPHWEQPQHRATSNSPCDPPPHFDLDTSNHDDQDPPVDPNDLGTNNNHDDLEDKSGGLLHGEPGDPSGPGGPGGPGGPCSPNSPDIPNKQRAILELLLGFKGSIETLGTGPAALGCPSDSSESKSKVKEPEVFDSSDPQKLKTFFVNLSLVFNDCPNGSAKKWSVPDILDPDLDSLPAWTSSFKALVKELQDNFGIYDVQGEAKPNTNGILAPTRDSTGRFVSAPPLSAAADPTEEPIFGRFSSDQDLGDWSPLDSPVKIYSKRQSRSSSPTKSKQPRNLTQNINHRPMATQQPLTRFSGDPDDPIQLATFLQDFEVRMTELMTPQADLAGRIKPYLERDSRAWEWYTEDLTATDRTGTWEAFEAKFHAWFPSQKKEKNLEGEQITHQLIIKTSEDTNQPYHQWWTDRLLRLAKGTEVEKMKQSIGTVWKHICYALKKVIDEEHDNWAEFTLAIKAVK